MSHGPNIVKATIGTERTVAVCKESLPTSRGPHRNRFLEVQAEIRSRMASDRNTLLAEANASAKRNLMSVGGCADTPVDLVAGGNADGKRPCRDMLPCTQLLLQWTDNFVGGTWMGTSRRMSGQ